MVYLGWLSIATPKHLGSHTISVLNFFCFWYLTNAMCGWGLAPYRFSIIFPSHVVLVIFLCFLPILRNWWLNSFRNTPDGKALFSWIRYQRQNWCIDETLDTRRTTSPFLPSNRTDPDAFRVQRTLPILPKWPYCESTVDGEHEWGSISKDCRGGCTTSREKD